MRSIAKLLFLALFISTSSLSFADMPGKPIRSDVLLKLQGIKTLAPYTLIIKDRYKDSLIKILSDTSYIITASQGAPHEIMIFGTSKKGNTDTIFCDEYNQRNAVISFSGVEGNKLQNIITQTSADTSSTDTSSKDAATTNNVSASNSISNSTHKWLIGISVSALVTLIIFLAVKNRKKNGVNDKKDMV
jgi:hypothetical protein